MCLFFFNDTATTEIYTLSLHDALPISRSVFGPGEELATFRFAVRRVEYLGSDRYVYGAVAESAAPDRSEEHTSELQSQSNIVCRHLLEKKEERFFMYSRTSTVNRLLEP